MFWNLIDGELGFMQFYDDLFKIQFSRFCFSSFRLQAQAFTLLLCKFYASYKLHFQIGFVCGILVLTSTQRPRAARNLELN
ncbi:hypothetical protein B0E44_15740 [Flavobacterium sp. A45]|nr:hypothetical protein B0E44_15740 [Flavobacterium sp. A45]